MLFSDLLDFVLKYAESIYSSFSEIFYYFTLTPADNISRIAGTSGNAFLDGALSLMVQILNAFAPYTIFELMFGIGLPFVIVWSLVSWVIDILP